MAALDTHLRLGGLQQASSLAAVDWGSAEDEDAPVIVALAAGSDVFGAHSAAVAMDGALYTWGLGVETRVGDTAAVVATGHRTMQAVLRPRRVQWLDGGAALPAMSAVSCGGSFCVALDPDGAAFSWGLWARGRLGLGEAPQLAQSRQAEQTDRKRLARFQLSPRAIGSAGDASNPKRRYRQVACGEAHCVALTLEGEVYAWGCNDQGQLGVGTTRSRLLEDEATPARVTFSDAGASIESVACGATHSVALDALGGAWSWGGGGGAMLGLGDRPRGGALATTNELMTQRVLEARRKSQRAAGAAPSRATARDVAFAAPRRIRGFGDGPASTKFVAVSCGERHTAFVSDARALLLCGDGVAMLGEAAVGGDAPVGDGDARQMPPEAAVIDSASVAVPRQPNARWLRRLRTARLDAVVCAGQHTVVLASGERAAAELGRKLLDNARRASRLLAASGFEDDEARPKQDSDDETDGEFDAEATPRAFGVDCMVVPGGGLPAYAHLSVLSARSSTFAELILLERRDDGGGAPGDVLQLLAPDLSPAALQHLLEFVYCDDVFEPTHGALHPTVLGELRRAADAYALPRLASICDDLLGTKLLDSLKVGAVSEGEEVESCFNDDFFSMVGDGSTADVTMLAGGGSVQVHKCVLEARSDFFRAMFKSGMREAGDDGVSAPMRAEVAVPDSAEGVARLMRLVYADDVEDGTVAQLLDDVAAADRYGLAPQKAACEATLLSALVGSPAAVPHALLVTSRFHASAAFDDVLAYAAGDLSKIDIAQLHAEPDVLAALLAALQRARPAALRPAAAPPAHAPEVEAAPLYDSSQTLSLPHALALLAAAAVLVLFQSRYRFRPVIVSGLNGVFIILVVVLFVHSSRLNETKRLQQTRARGVHLKSPAA